MFLVLDKLRDEDDLAGFDETLLFIAVFCGVDWEILGFLINFFLHMFKGVGILAVDVMDE